MHVAGIKFVAIHFVDICPVGLLPFFVAELRIGASKMRWSLLLLLTFLLLANISAVDSKSFTIFLHCLMTCLLVAPQVQLFADAGDGWPHSALRYHANLLSLPRL